MRKRWTVNVKRKVKHLQNVMRTDPSRTSALRRKVGAELRRRYMRLRKAILTMIRDRDALGLKQNQYTHNTAWKYETSAGKVKRFRAWLRQQMDSTLAGDVLIEQWIQEAHGRGAKRAFDELRKGSDTSLVYPNLPSGMGGSQSHDMMRAEALRRIKTHKPTVEKVKLLAGRTFSELEGINAQMATKMSRLLAEGLARGWTPTKIANQMSRQVSISLKQAIAITRSELIRAHAEGTLDGMADQGETKVTAQVEFLTADDDRVCVKCRSLEGRVYSIEDARGVIPVHPLCRCTWLSVKQTRKRMTRNAFCPTGKGGGVNPHCPPHTVNPSDLTNVDSFNELKSRFLTNISNVPDPQPSLPSKANVKLKTSNGDDETTAIKHLSNFFSKSIIKEDIASLVGAPDDSTVVADFNTKTNTLSISIDSKDIDACRRTVKKETGGSIYIQNDTFVLRPQSQGKGIGTQVFSKQVEYAQKLGVKYIQTDAALDDTGRYTNGYTTWPKLGYDCPLSKLEPNVRKEAKELFPHASSMSDIMMIKQGRDWWESFGHGLSGMKFDLSPGSRSLKTLHAYLAERGRSTGSIQSVNNTTNTNHSRNTLSENPDLSRPESQALERMYERMSSGKSIISNAFCHTGDGGGIDPTCPPHESRGGSADSNVHPDKGRSEAKVDADSKGTSGTATDIKPQSSATDSGGAQSDKGRTAPTPTEPKTVSESSKESTPNPATGLPRTFGTGGNQVTPQGVMGTPFFSGIPKTIDGIYKGSSGPKPSLNDLADMAGAQPGSKVTARVVEDGKTQKVVPGSDKKEIQILVDHADLGQTMKRRIGRDAEGNVFMHNEFIRVFKKGGGTGTDIFGRGVENAKRLGAKYIACHAARYDAHGQDTMTGYKCWPAMGYDESLKSIEGYNSKGAQSIREMFPHAQSIQDVMDAKGGYSWWEKNGFDLHHMKFDLADGSRSMKQFATYLTESKKKREAK